MGVDAIYSRYHMNIGYEFDEYHWYHENPWYKGDPGDAVIVDLNGAYKDSKPVWYRVTKKESGFDFDYKIYSGSLFQNMSEGQRDRLNNIYNNDAYPVAKKNEYYFNLNLNIKYSEGDFFNTKRGHTTFNFNILHYYSDYLNKDVMKPIWKKSVKDDPDSFSFIIKDKNGTIYPQDGFYCKIDDPFMDPSVMSNRFHAVDHINLKFNNYFARMDRVKTICTLPDPNDPIETTSSLATTNNYLLKYDYTPIPLKPKYTDNVNFGYKYTKDMVLDSYGNKPRQLYGTGLGSPSLFFMDKKYDIDLTWFNYSIRVNKLKCKAPKNLKSNNQGLYTWEPVKYANGIINYDETKTKAYTISYCKIINGQEGPWTTIEQNETQFQMPLDYFYTDHKIKVKGNGDYKLYPYFDGWPAYKADKRLVGAWWFYDYAAYTDGEFTEVQEIGKVADVWNTDIKTDVNEVTISWDYTFEKYENPITFVLYIYSKYDSTSEYKKVSVGNKTTYKDTFPVGNHKIIIQAIDEIYPDSISKGVTVYASTVRISTPGDLSFELTSTDKGNFSWHTDLTDDERFIYRTFLNDIQYNETNNTETLIENLEQGKNIVAVQQVFLEDETYNSDKATLEITTGKLSAPYNLKFTRQSVNSGKLSWSSTNTEIIKTDFSIYIDGIEVKEKTKNTNIILTDLKQGTRKFEVKQNYNLNPDYTSPLSTVLSYDMTKISKPTISLKENYADVKYTDPNTGKVVYVKDAQGNNIQGVSSVNANWDTTDTAKFGGIEFILYDRWNAEISEFQSSAKTLLLSTQPTYKGVGVHNLYVKSIFPADQDYNSDLSSEVQYEVNTLGKPSLTWANELPSWNGKRIFESKLTWLPVTTGSATGEHADYYLIKAIADDKDQGNGVTILQPTDLTKRLETFIPDPDPFTGDIKGLISSDPSKTTDYKINVYAMSFNEFYVGGSQPGTADYKIIRLNKPTNVQFNPDNLTLSWDAVTDANKYYIYDSGNKIAETDKTTYKFDNLENDLHIFQISAMKITKEEA